MKIVYFFRKRIPEFHSIEELFGNIQKKLPEEYKFSNLNVKYVSSSILKILYNCLEVIFKQQEINHITGDIHYIALLLRKNKTILTIHDIGSMKRQNGLKNRFIKLLWYTLPLPRVRYITVISEFTKKELLQYININPDKIKVIPNCYPPEIDFLPKPNINTTKPTLLHIGTTANKNLINNIKAIYNYNCTLIIVGFLSESQRECLQQHNIEYINYCNIPFASIIDLYHKTDLLLFTSTYEGFGLPIIEANAAGCPVITSALSPMQEVAAESALLIDPAEPTQIRQAIERIVGDNALRQSLIAKGYANAQKYSAQAIAQMYADLYKQMLK